jgi:hypothetical protein
MGTENYSYGKVRVFSFPLMCEHRTFCLVLVVGFELGLVFDFFGFWEFSTKCDGRAP